MFRKYEIAIGIDTGVNTGFAIWNKTDKRFEEVKTLMIHEAIFKIKSYHEQGFKMFVRVEDARKRKWVPGGRERLQGVGSVKRDCKIMEDFLRDYNIPHEMVAPKNNKTKLSKEQFFNLTKYTGQTSEHSRDAAGLVFGL